MKTLWFIIPITLSLIAVAQDTPQVLPPTQTTYVLNIVDKENHTQYDETVTAEFFDLSMMLEGDKDVFVTALSGPLTVKAPEGTIIMSFAILPKPFAVEFHEELVILKGRDWLFTKKKPSELTPQMAKKYKAVFHGEDGDDMRDRTIQAIKDGTYPKALPNQH